MLLLPISGKVETEISFLKNIGIVDLPYYVEPGVRLVIQNLYSLYSLYSCYKILAIYPHNTSLWLIYFMHSLLYFLILYPYLTPPLFLQVSVILI